MSSPPRRTVACVLKEGRGNYSEEWVFRLKYAVEQNLSGRFDFVCLSDRPIPGVDRIPLTEGWPHWWSKIELFKPGQFSGPVLYLDLDVLITGPIDTLFSSRGLMMWRDPYRADTFNSSVMSWNEDHAEIFVEFQSAPHIHIRGYDRFMAGRVGDQAFIEDYSAEKISELGNGSILSYKADCAKQAPPDSASIVVFHGYPKPANAPGWPSQIWRDTWAEIAPT